MATKTYSENLEIIRGQNGKGVYGTDVREAIASVIEQAGDRVNSVVGPAKTEIISKVDAAVSAFSAEVIDFMLTCDNKIASTISTIEASIQAVSDNCNSQIVDIGNRVDSRNIYMTTTKIATSGTENDYLLTITNAMPAS